MKKQRTTIGRIDLMQNFSFFEVAEKQANDVINALNKVNLNGRKVIVEVAGENNGKSDKSGAGKKEIAKKKIRGPAVRNADTLKPVVPRRMIGNSSSTMIQKEKAKAKIKV